MAKTPVRRKICIPYDTVCLEGGCHFCEDCKWRTIETLRKDTEAMTDPKYHKAFLWGLQHDFANAQVKYDDGTLKY